MHQRLNRATEWKVQIDLLVAAQIEQRLMDPMTRKPRYGLRSKLVNELLRRYIAEHPSALVPALTEAEINAINGGA